MNKNRRKQIANLIVSLETIKSKIDNILSDEQEYLDNIPENLQCSERYDVADNAIGSLDLAISNVDEALSALEEAQA